MVAKELTSFVEAYERAAFVQLPILLAEWDEMDGEDRSDAVTELRLLLLEEEQLEKEGAFAQSEDLASRLARGRSQFFQTCVTSQSTHPWLRWVEKRTGPLRESTSFVVASPSGNELPVAA